VIVISEPYCQERIFHMATALPQSTLHSSENPHSSRILIGGLIAGLVGIAVGGILAEGGHYVGERDCPRVELCAPADRLWLPDGSENGPANPPGKSGTGLVVTAPSTLTPTTASMLLTDK
jgi:hypothetical protein